MTTSEARRSWYGPLLGCDSKSRVLCGVLQNCTFVQMPNADRELLKEVKKIRMPFSSVSMSS